MTMTRLFSLLSAISVGATTTLLAAYADARQCEADADCPKGFTCEESTATACTDPAPCAEGEDCPARDSGCVSETISSCQSIDCASDSDCAEGMTCVEVEMERCAQPACPADGECPKPESTCEAEPRSYCVPSYLLPCSADSDCGPGFSCREQEACACGGSAGNPEPSPGAAPPDEGGGSSGFAPADPDADPAEMPAEDENCGCEPSGEFACVLDQAACTSDADCQAGFTCEDNPNGVCWASPDGDMGCSTPDPAKLCMPPYTDLYGGVGRSEDGAVSYPEAPAGDPSSDPGDQNTAGEGAAADDAGAAGGESESGGCSVAAAGAPASWGLTALALFGLAGLRRRRSAVHSG